MNNFYHKIAVASICTALSFTLGANQEAKAATFTLTAPRFLVFGTSESGGLEVLPNDYAGPSLEKNDFGGDYTATRAFYEFDIGNFSLAPDTVISRAFFNVRVRNIEYFSRYFFLDIVGYVGNGMPDLSDFDAGEPLAILIDILPGTRYPVNTINLDVTQFVNQRVSNGDVFAGLGIRSSTFISDYTFAKANLDYIAELNIETEPVPEPTTIFGSVLGLGVGGWLKRKKSSQQNKTTTQH